MDHIKTAYAWREALELSKRLVAICEEFSDAESNVLVWHLRQAVVDVPATIAADLQANRGATMEPIIKLMAELELVRKIYPAIETGDAEQQVEKLIDRLQSDRFGEREPDAEPEGETDKDGGNDGAESGGSTTVQISPQVDGVHQAASQSEPNQEQ